LAIFNFWYVRIIIMPLKFCEQWNFNRSKENSIQLTLLYTNFWYFCII